MARCRASRPYNAANIQAGYPGGKVGQWENRSNMTVANNMEAEQGMVDINWDFGDSMSVEFLTAYTSQFNKLANDWDGSQYDVVYDLNQQDNQLWSQEIQFSGGRGRVDLARRRLLLGAGHHHARHA